MVDRREYSQTALRAREALANVAALPGVAKPDPILRANGVQRKFGGISAVDVAHLEVQRGSITALIRLQEELQCVRHLPAVPQ